jgi:hypothetical protein
MPDFYVVSEDGDSLHTEAESAQHAAEAAVREWGIEADAGYRFKVFAAEDAKTFKTAQHLEPCDA